MPIIRYDTFINIDNVYTVVIIGERIYMTYIAIAILCFCLGWSGAMIFYLFGLKKKHKKKFKKELKEGKKSELQEELEKVDK